MQHRVKDLLEELRSRSVIRALIAYAVAAWVLLQIADVTFDRLPIPDNAMTVLIIRRDHRVPYCRHPRLGLRDNSKRDRAP